ncbi:hypothetical protein HMPREF3190_01082 [Umbribacter vaginalis]|nr:hypothetical protein HMPREF3190_01082 [Coriobacteriales bacterium DNF00809]
MGSTLMSGTYSTQTRISRNPASAPSQSQQVAGSHSASAPATSASTTPNATPSSNSTQPPHPAGVATFTCLYESKDKKYCLFADENGHLTSVKAHRLS